MKKRWKQSEYGLGPTDICNAIAWYHFLCCGKIVLNYFSHAYSYCVLVQKTHDVITTES